MNLRPLKTQVLVRYIKPEAPKAGEIWTGNRDDNALLKVEVIAVGSGYRDQEGNSIPYDFKVGDRVLLERIGGMEIKEGSERFLLVPADNIAAILD